MRRTRRAEAADVDGSRTSDELAAMLLAADVDRADPDALRTADRPALAAALRRAVAHLPVLEQRRRLAAAFAVLAVVTRTDPTTPGGAGPRRPMMKRHLTPARLGIALASCAVAALAGVGLGALTDGDPGGPVEVDAAAEQPVPLLEPVAVGDEAPDEAFVQGLMPPDPATQSARSDAVEETPALEDREADEDEDDASDPDEASGVDAPRSIHEPTVAGLADAAAVFADRDGADGDGAAGDEAAGDGADGDGVDEPVGLVDPCATTEPAPDCEGVGGTVVVSIVEPFRFNHDPLVFGEPGPTCLSDAPASPDQFVVLLGTNHLGSFTMRHRASGSTGPFAETTGETPEFWRAHLDDGTAPQAVTCLLADRPAGAPSMIEVDITGVGTGESGTARYTGDLELPPPVEPESEDEATRRAGRPPVTIRARTASTLRVTVPVGRSEQTLVSLAMLDPDDPELDCASAPPDRITPAGPVAGVRRVDDIVIDDWVDREFDVTAPATGPALVCVEWQDDFEPPRTLEKASIPVVVAGAPGVDVLLAGYGPARSATTQPTGIELTVRDRNGPCGGATLDADALRRYADRDDPAVLCRLEAVPTHIGLLAAPSFDGGAGAAATQRGLIAVPQECPDGSPTCTTWFLKSVKAPDRSLSGSLVIGVRLTGSASPDSVSIGAEVPELVDDETGGGPRLDWDRVSAVVDPADPARRVVVSWASDLPAVTTVTAEPMRASRACPPRRAAASPRGTDGSVTIDGLCPGSEYLVHFDLRGDEGSTLYRVTGGTDPAPDSDRRRIVRSARVTTADLAVEYDYQLTFRETLDGENVTGKGVIPERIAVVFPRSYDPAHPTYEFLYSQYYDGRARFGLDCADPAHFDQAGSGVRATLRGGRFALQESTFIFDIFDSAERGVTDTAYGRRCPSPANQFHQSPSDPRRTCGPHITALEPQGSSDHLAGMLSGEPAVFVADVPMCRGGTARRFTVTLTVQLREVRTLSGTVG